MRCSRSVVKRLVDKLFLLILVIKTLTWTNTGWEDTKSTESNDICRILTSVNLIDPLFGTKNLNWTVQLLIDLSLKRLLPSIESYKDWWLNCIATLKQAFIAYITSIWISNSFVRLRRVELILVYFS